MKPDLLIVDGILPPIQDLQDWQKALIDLHWLACSAKGKLSVYLTPQTKTTI